jgi:uncharacterized repeat protein (TIGR02543 family)
MKKFKNLAVVLSLVLVLNTILPQAAVFAQTANNSLGTNGSTVNVTLADVDPAFGTVTLTGTSQTGPGAYPQGSVLKVDAVANPGYAVYLISASMGGLIYETPLTPTTFNLTDDTVISVTFYAVTPPPVSTVEVQVEDLNPTLGNVTFSGANGQTGNGAYPTGSTLNINVTPVNGFKVTTITAAFADGTSQEVDNQPTADFILHDDVIISFSFEGAYNIVVESSDPTRGTVFNESSSYSLLDSIYLYAMPNPGYECNGYYFTDTNNYSSYTPYTQPVNVPVTESGTYQMIFEPTMCSVAVVSDGNGTVTGGGNVANGSKVTLTATPDSGYKFSQWTDQNNAVVGTSATLNIPVTDNITYTASFIPDTVVIQVSGTPTSGGTVSGDGTYVSGATVTLTATPTAGYTFVNWINSESQAVVSKKASYAFTASDATAGIYAAVFQATQIPVKISTIASPAALQTITVTPVSGNYASGTVLALSAGSTDSGVTFSGWYANGILLSKSPAFSYTVTEPVLINAVFGTNWGSVIVLGNPFSSRNVDIEVQPIGTNLSFNGSSDTYDFINWTNSAGKVVSTDPNLTVQVQKGLQTFIANVTPKTFTISVAATPTPGGTAQVTSATSITYGKTATVVATPANGYSFTGWTDGDTGQSVSTDQTYVFEPSKNTRLIANFSQQGYTLSLTANPTNGGTVSSGGTNLVYGQVVNIQASPADGYVFSGWVDGSGNTVSNKPDASITITGNQALTANFSAVQYPITVTPSPATGGTVAGGGTFEDGASVTLTAIPNANYNFIRWTQGDSDLAVSTNPQYTFTASEASQGQYTAVFAPETYLVNISMVAQKSIEDQVSVSPAKDIYSYGTVLNMAANTTNTEILFLGWFEDGKLISKTADFNYTVTQATNLVAVFVTDYGAIITQGDPAAAKKTDILIGPKNTTKTISAETSPNYDFTNWTDAAGIVYPDDTFDVTIGPDLVVTYVAHYTPKTFTVVAAGQTPGGTVSQSQASVLYGQSLTVTATPDMGYTFVSWTDALADPQPGAVLSTDANWILQPDANMSLQANFAPIAYTVGINTAASGGGTAAWTNYPTDGPFYGDVITAVATPDANYVFDGWVNALGDIVSMDSTFDVTVTGNDTLTAQFHTSQNSIGAAANPTTMGTVNGGGTYAYRTQATLTAIPNTGFEFVNWTNNLDDTVITTSELVVNVANDVIYTANFDVLQCPVTLTPVDPGRSVYGSVAMAVYENGVLAPAGTIPEYGDKVVLTATANQTMPNVIFKDYLDSTGTLISYDAVYTIDAITESLAIQYDFVQEYTVTVPVSAEWTDNYQRNLLPGVVPQVTQFPNSGVTGNFKDSITLNYGTVDPNLVFDGWYTDEETPILVSSALSFSYQLLDSTPLVARLHLKDIGILVENAYVADQTIPGVDLNGGEVSGSGYRNVGESVNISSTVDANYSFENWTQGSTTLSKKTSFNYTVGGQPGIDAPPIQANYSPNACYLTLNVSPKGGGQAAPSGYYPYGTLVTISQGNQAGYAFSHFEDSNGNTLKSVTSNTKAGTLTLYMTGNTTVVAVYKESSGSEAQRIVKIAAAAATAAAIAAGIAAAIYFGGDELLADGALDLAEVALEDLGEVAGGVVDHNPPDPDPDPDNPDDKTDILITAAASPVDAGTAIGGETYRVGEMAVLKATANPGWVFENWSSEGAVVIDDPEAKSISFLVDEADEGSVLTAHFKQEFTITTSATPEIGGTITPTEKVVSGKTAIVTATPNEGYLFDGWYENGVQVSTEESYTLEAVAADHNLTAQFEAGFEVTLIADPVAMDTLVTFTGNGLSKAGEHTITAALLGAEAENYVFNGWYVNLTDPAPVSADETYTFNITADTSYIASYSEQYTITTSATPAEGGTVTPTEQVIAGGTATVTATANEGYLFDGWYENGVQVSTEETYTLEAVAADHSLTAQFEAGFNVTLTADPVAMDTLVTFTGNGLSQTGEHTITATLIDTETENYVFNGWYVNLADPEPVSTEESYTFNLTADTSYIASYSEQYTITTSATPEEGGTVSPSQQVTVGNDATVTATPNEGYVFDGWYEGEAQVSEDESYTLTAVAADHSLTAQFELGANVALTANPTTMESLVTLTGNGLSQMGEHTITATLDDAETDNYIFKGWFSALTDDVPASTSETYTFDLTADVSYIASYQENAFTVTAKSADETQGTVTQTGTSPYKLSDSVTVSAVIEKGYSFANWTDENSAVVSKTADYTFDVTENTTLTANFEAEPAVTIQVQCDYVEGGTVTSDDKDIPETGLVITNGESVTLKAEEKKGYEFEGWYENGKEIEKKDAYTFTAAKDRTLVAAFSHKGIMALAFPNPLEGGRVYKVYQTSETKDEFYLNAVPFTGYEFVGWYDIAGIKVCDTPEYDFVAYYSRVLFAKFKLEQVAVNVGITPVGGGTVSGTGTYDYGTAVTLTATPEEGYIFNGFMDATGNRLSSDAVYVFTLRAEADLTASFSPQTYTMTTTVNDPALGTVANSDSDEVYPAGAVVSLKASPASGSQFVGWFENGQCVSQTPNYSFTATADRNLEADFSNEEFVLTLMADPVTGGTLSGEGGYNPSSEADQASIAAVALPGYSFTAWTDADTGEQVSTLSSDAITLTKDTNLTAVFTPNVYQVELTVGDGGNAAGDGYYNFGDTVNLSATAKDGYSFAGWMITDAQGTQSCISSDGDYTFTLNEDWINLAPITISATFKNTKGALIIPLAEEYLRGNIARGYHLDATVGNQTTVEAIPGYGYEFTNWTDVKGNVVSPEAVYTFTVTGDTVLIAHFKSNATVKLSVTEQSVLQGKALLVGDLIAGEKTVESGQYVMAYAVAYPGYKFLHWVNQNGLKLSNARSYPFRIYEDTTLTAVFEKTTHDISANVDPHGAGYITGQQTYAYGDTATLTAIPTELGYIFGYWSDENGRIKGAISPVFKTTVNGSKTYTAHFVQGKYSITAKAVPEQGGTVSGGGSFGQEEAVTLMAVANTGYQFDGWFVGGTSVSTAASWAFDATESIDAEAHFSTIPLSDSDGPSRPHPGLPHRGRNK